MSSKIQVHDHEDDIGTSISESSYLTIPNLDKKVN